MSKRSKKKGVNLLGVIIAIVLIILAVIFITRNIDKENKENEEHNISNKTQETVDPEKYVKILEDGTKLNISEKLKETKKIEEVANLELKDIQLTYKNGVTNILATVENKSQNKSETKIVEITLLDDEGNTIYKLQGIVEEVEAGATTKFNCSVTADFANAYDLKINVK